MTIRNVIRISIILMSILIYSAKSFASEINIIKSDHNQFKFSFNLPDVKYINATQDGKKYKIPLIDGAEIENSSLSNYQLVYKYKINIPFARIPLIFNESVSYFGHSSNLEVDENKTYSDIDEDFQFPATKIKRNDFGDIKKNFNDFVKIKYIGIAGSKHVAEISIYPYLYQHDDNVIIFLNDFVAQINFGAVKNKSKNTENFNYANTLNYNDTPNWSIFDNESPNMLSQEKSMSELSNGNWIKLEVAQHGVYQIDAADIQSMGYQLSANDVKSIKIFGIGGKPLPEDVNMAGSLSMNEQEIIVNTNSDGSLKNILFFGAGPNGFEQRSGKIQRFNNYYNNNISYLLTWGGVDGKRATEQEVPSGEVVHNPTNYIERYLFEEDIINPYQPGAGRDWFGRSFFSMPFNPVMLHNLDRSGEISYRFGLAHHAEEVGNYKVFENNSQIGSISLPTCWDYVAATREFLETKIPANSINNDNRSVIKLEYNNTNDKSASAYFDYYEIHYPRSLLAINNTINLIPELNQSGITQYNFNGFSGQIYGFDISDLANPKLVRNNSSTGSMFVLKCDLKANNFSNYFLSSNILKPIFSKIEISNIRDNNDNSDIIVVTHQDLIESANKYVEYRRIQGHKVSLFTTNHIFNEFAAGNNDITAIRDCLSYLKTKWGGKPDYVVLWGDGHYDFRALSTKKVNYLPAYQTFSNDLEEFSEINEAYATDDFFARLLGNDDYYDIRIGRVTIDEPKIGDDVFNKIKDYEQNLSIDQFRTNILLVADDGPTSKDYDGAMHTVSSEKLQREILSNFAPDLQYDKLYLVEYPSINASGGKRKPQVTEDLLTKLNTSGALILNWFGHGNPRVWAHENILERDITIPKMVNKTKPFFLTAATCDYGRFDNPEVRSGAEEMFISRNGGAIGVFSATRVVYASENESLAKEFFKILLTKDPISGEYPTLGDATMKVKLIKNVKNDRKYFLLGDPLVKIALPDYEIKIESINDKSVENLDSAIELKALSEITIVGYVYDKLGKNKLSDFNGSVTLTLRDGDKEIGMYEMVDGVQKSFYVFNKLGSSLNQSTYKVENGKFIAKFYIPKDISFSEVNAKLFTYAYSEDKRYAKGVFDNIKIAEFDEVSSINDKKGPDIDIYLDSRKFIEGEMVSSSPLLILDLYDESGINTTGLGIGHRIEAWVDDSKTSIDLTDKFVSSLTDSRRGIVNEVLYGLGEGTHTIKIRAWDVFNNFSIKESKFRISNKSVFLDNLLAIPNPFESTTKLYFRHTAELPAVANIEIYTINGQLIRFLQSDINTSFESEVFWDGLDNSGMQIPLGIYIFKVELPNKNGEKIVKFGKVIKIK